MAWWTRIVGGSMAGIEKHKDKLGAGIRLSFAINHGGADREACGLYKRNPEKYPDEPNLLPAELEKVRVRKLAQEIRRIMGRKGRKGRREC